MPVWRVACVSDEPEIPLSRWRVLQIEDGTRHFMGTDERDDAGRVSSAIVAFDRHTLRGRTLSGRIYQLIGEAGWSSDADYVWERWCVVNNVSSYIDVTKQLLAGAQE